MKRVPLKALLLLLTFALGSFTVSGTVLPFTISDAHKTSGGFLLTVSPPSILVSQGMNATSTVTVASTSGFSGVVSLTAQVMGRGIGVIFNPTMVNVPAGGTRTSITTVEAAKNASMMTYNIIVTGISVSGKRVLSSSALLTLTVDPQADFGVYAVPSMITVVAGFSNSTSVQLKSENGFNGSITLYATVPFGFLGVMGGRNPVSLTPGATATTSLQVSATSATMLGQYNITITGAYGSISHSSVLIVNVVDPAPELLTLSGFSTTSPTSLTLSLLNGGNTPTTLQSYSVADISGDVWILSNWTGPTISAGNVGPAVISIGSSCPTCIYNGVPLLFQQFLTGHTYLVTVTTKLNTQFTYTVAL
jgi:hypothetical protein